MAGTATSPRSLEVDRLGVPGTPLQVVLVDDASFGEDASGSRAPHRHDYHELFWTKAGEGRHLVDGEPTPVRPGTVTLIGRGQVHVLERARGLSAAVVRFGDELLHGDPSALTSPAWLLGGRGALSVAVPAGDAARMDGVIAALEAESRRPLDAVAFDLRRHLLAVLLLWVERWYDAARTERREAGDADTQVFRRFARVLARDFAAHHDAAHYADALALPPAALSRALAQVTGRTTKELVTDRVMLEAARLLAFTDRTVGEVAHATGFADQLYFSRSFRRHRGEAPTAYRERVRGRS
jgi:AraC family transcriptional activator of pobA